MKLLQKCFIIYYFIKLNILFIRIILHLDIFNYYYFKSLSHIYIINILIDLLLSQISNFKNSLSDIFFKKKKVQYKDSHTAEKY